MPALPWVERQPIDRDRTYLAMASRLPLRSHLSTPGFLWDTMRIRRQLRDTEGLVGYALNAELTRRTFWTFSLWDDRAGLDTFAAASPHRAIIERLRPRMGETRFAFLDVAGADLPMSWEQMSAPVR